MYRTEVKVVTMPVNIWMRDYWKGTEYTDACKACPFYGNRWSCPPGVPDTWGLVEAYKTVEIIGVRVFYDEETRKKALCSQEQKERMIRQQYGKVKKNLLEALILLETLFPTALSIMAGGCLVCESCSRETGEQCRHPDMLRYSYSGLGFDLGRLSEKVLEMPLLWQEKGLPAYQVAIASLLHS